jgi:hypothetical protein
MEAREALLPVATFGLGLLQSLLDLEQEEPVPFSFLDAAAADNAPARPPRGLGGGVAPMLGAAVGVVLRTCVEAVGTQTAVAAAGWRGIQGVGWVLGGAGAGADASGSEKKPEESNGNGAGEGEAAESAAAAAAAVGSVSLPPPVGRGSGALLLAAMRGAEALSVDSSTQRATTSALAAPLAAALALPEEQFQQWWCGGGAAHYVHAGGALHILPFLQTTYCRLLWSR